MKYRKTFGRYLLFFLIALMISACSKEDQTDTILKGTVTGLVDGEPIFPAFLIQGDMLLATTHEDGSYEISSLDPGISSLLCSAINYADHTVQVEVSQGETLSNDFKLLTDDRIGRVYGEFHDKELYLNQLAEVPGMGDWSGQELFDGVSGATIESSFDMPSSEIFMGDSLFAYADGYGQFWFDIQCGTYPVTGSVSGYIDTLLIINIEPDSEVYINYILSR